MKSSKKSLKAALVFVLALILLTNAVLPMAVVGSNNDAAAEYQYYSVKAGDTLTRIAKNYGVTVSDLMTANDLSNADKIYTGQIIKVPLSSASAKGNTLVSSRISMTVVEADIEDVLSAIALNAGYYIIMEEGKSQTVTVTLQEMSALKAIDYVTRLVGMTFLKEGNTIYVGTADALNSTFVDKTVLTKIHLDYISAEGLQTQMSALGLSNVQIVSTNNKDEFYISGYPKELAKVSELIKLLDVSSNIMAGGGMIASNFTPLELEYITAEEFNGLLGNLGLSTGIVLSSRPYTLYVYVSGANLTDIKTIQRIVDKPLTGANLAAQGTTTPGGGGDVTITEPSTAPTTEPSTEPTTGSTGTPTEPTTPTEEPLVLREVELTVIDRSAAEEILNSFPLTITVYGPKKMTKKLWIAGTEDQVDQAEAYIRQFDNADYAASVLNDKRFFAYELQNCTAAEMLNRLAALELEGVTFKTGTYSSLTKSLIVYCEPYLEESVKALLLEMDTTATSETANRAIEATSSTAVARQRIDALCALYPELNAYEFTVTEIPGKDGAMKCVTYVKASSETADYIKALFEEMNTAA